MLAADFGDVDQSLLVGGVSDIGPDILAEKVVDLRGSVSPYLGADPDCVCGDGDGVVGDLKSDLSLFEVVNNFVERHS